MAEVLLICMPYGAIERPSIALGSLKSSLARYQIQSEVIYANLEFADQIGVGLYNFISNRGDCSDLLGEWTFSQIAFSRRNENDLSFLQSILGGTYTEFSFGEYMPGVDLGNSLLEARKSARLFIKKLAAEIFAKKPSIVGCSSCFQQHCASFALLREIRRVDSSLITMIGGANCEGVMGLSTKRVAPFIDYVVSGEAEESLPKLVKLLREYGRNVDLSLLPQGVIGSGDGNCPEKEPPRCVISDLNTIGVPDYDDYFQQLRQHAYHLKVLPGIPIETSRGCWWGQHRPCTFCGLNGIARHYRGKSAKRILREVRHLAQRYGIRKFEAVDNTLNYYKLKPVFRALSRRSSRYSFFFEARANLTSEQLRLMRKAGVKWIQVGLESMNDNILGMLGKGSDVLQNICLLKSAFELNMRVSWNLLFGIPDEDDSWYLEMAAWLPLLYHLEPPKNMVRLRFDRFSLYHEKAEDFGLQLKAKRSYDFVYPSSDELKNNLAYYFEDTRSTARASLNRPGLKALEDTIREWHRCFWQYGSSAETALLVRVDKEKKSMILDTRPVAKEILSALDAQEGMMLRMCESPQTTESLYGLLARRGKCCLQYNDLDKLLVRLIEKKWILKVGGRFLNLAVSKYGDRLLKMEDFPGGYIK